LLSPSGQSSLDDATTLVMPRRQIRRVRNMHARVSTYTGPADQYAAGLEKLRDATVPQLGQVDGFRGVLALIDRGSGKALSITFWESEDALRASAEEATQLREQIAAASSEQIIGVENYEVALLEMP
jgi:heme-degrading monooxygenase HmoA